jgi:hypothetical protein
MVTGGQAKPGLVVMVEDCIEGLDANQEHPIADTGLSPTPQEDVDIFPS